MSIKEQKRTNRTEEKTFENQQEELKKRLEQIKENIKNNLISQLTTTGEKAFFFKGTKGLVSDFESIIKKIYQSRKIKKEQEIEIERAKDVYIKSIEESCYFLGIKQANPESIEDLLNNIIEKIKIEQQSENEAENLSTKTIKTASGQQGHIVVEKSDEDEMIIIKNSNNKPQK